MRNSFRNISSIVILICFCCSSVMGYTQSGTVTLQGVYGIQKGQDNKQTSINVAVNSSDILLENETEDNEESQDDVDVYNERADFKIKGSNLIDLRNTECGNSISLMILYCVFRI